MNGSLLRGRLQVRILPGSPVLQDASQRGVHDLDLGKTVWRPEFPDVRHT